MITALQQAAVIAKLRARAASVADAIAALGQGDSQSDAFYALTTAQRWIDALERNAERRRASEEGSNLWIKDARECEATMASLPADAAQGTIEDILKQTAAATVTTVAKLPGQALDAAAGGIGFTLAAIWNGLPWWTQGALVVGGVGVVGFLGWRGYRLVKDWTS